ncbi:MAG: N-acetylneuraminate synthase family protein [Pseudomonadota bacterium]
MAITLNDGRTLGGDAPPYVVAEFNTSHFGDVELASQMIATCAEIGVDCVKFQSWSVESLYSETFYSANKMAKRFVKKYALPEDALKHLAGVCRDHGIGFMSTPYSVDEARFLLDHCNTPALKIASMEINNLPYLKALGGMETALILSTGMADLGEIETAVRTLEEAGARDLCVLHCVSQYPIETHQAHVRNVRLLQDRFEHLPIGYSDHTLDLDAPVAATALGACLIERHFTLDRSRIGMDNQMATEPEAFAELIRRCRATYDALGSYERVVSQEELTQRGNMRRSVVYGRDMAAGTVLQEADLIFKRPGTGIAPTDVAQLLGKTLLQNVSGDHLASMDHVRAS